MRGSLVSQFFREAAGLSRRAKADKLGVKIVLEPEYGFAGQIILPNGQYRYFRDTHLDINGYGAARIANDKDYAGFFLARFGYPTPEGQKFYAKKRCRVLKSGQDIDAGWAYAQKLGLPVIVKPNNGSKGRGFNKVYNKTEFYSAARKILRKNQIMLVQRIVTGQDYRVVVFDGKVYAAYLRVPCAIRGDGASNIRQLLRQRQREFLQKGRSTQLTTGNPQIKNNLARLGFSLETILAKGKEIYLLENANLSTGGEGIDVTDKISAAFKKIAIDISRKMNLRYCGVDILTTEPIETKKPKNYVILEINSGAGLDHFAKIGPKQEQIVRGLYYKIFEALVKSS